MHQPLVVEIWGKQADTEQAQESKGETNRKKSMSTKQLMNADNISKANSMRASTTDNDDNKYKLMSELNSMKKRNNRIASRMVTLTLYSFSPKLIFHRILSFQRFSI